MNHLSSMAGHADRHDAGVQIATAFDGRPPRRRFAADPARQAPPVYDRGTALPPNDFVAGLRREMRRAERTNTPLSLVIYQLDDGRTDPARQADRLLDLLHRTRRETDLLGLVGDDTIAVLCPGNDEAGMRGFMRKIDSVAGGMTLACASATYPDDLFESLATGNRSTLALPALRPFLACGAAGTDRIGYPLKRTLDIVGALLCLCLCAPLMLVVALAIAASSPGPVIFRQARLGRGGVPFTFYKFCSMHIGADDSVHRAYVASLIAGEAGAASKAGGAPYKLQADARVTRIGRFIRKTSIDELPQMLNVLKGDMSLVGPRPPIPYEASHYQSWHLRRILSIRPGITGLWQVEGRSRVTFSEMVRMDLRYQRECSLALDLKLLLRTVLVVARCDGAV